MGKEKKILQQFYTNLGSLRLKNIANSAFSPYPRINQDPCLNAFSADHDIYVLLKMAQHTNNLYLLRLSVTGGNDKSENMTKLQHINSKKTKSHNEICILKKNTKAFNWNYTVSNGNTSPKFSSFLFFFCV